MHRGDTPGSCVVVRQDEAVAVDGLHGRVAAVAGGAAAVTTPAVEELAGLFGLVSLEARPYLVGFRETEVLCVLAGPGHAVLRAQGLSLLRLLDWASLGAPGAVMSPEEDDFLSFLKSFCFCFSPTYDFTQTLQRAAEAGRQQQQQLDRRFFWNATAAAAFVGAGLGGWVQPVTDAFVGVAEEGGLQYVLVSRRSRRRQGARFLVRGADLLGNVANWVETEQIVSWGGRAAAFVQARGSIPVCWQQRGDGGELMPLPRVQWPPLWSVAHRRHWEELTQGDTAVTAVSLVDQHGAESVLGQAYESAVRVWNAERPGREVRFVWFDFHAECKRAGYQVLGTLSARVLGSVESSFFCPSAGLRQTALLRTNCVDCLDRTNVVQSVFGRRVLDQMAAALGAGAAASAESFEARFKHVWADNADAMSLRYTGVGALKTDFTRSGKRSGKGIAQDAIKSVKRLAQHKFRDGDKQHLLDLLLGQEVSAERRAPERGAAHCFYASLEPVSAAPDAAAFVAAAGVALALVEAVPGVLVVHVPARRTERRFPRERLLAALPLPERPAGARLLWRDQPEPLKLHFFSPAVRDRFLALLAPTAALPLLPALSGPPAPLVLLLVGWRGLRLPPSEACVPGTAAALAARLFGGLRPQTPPAVAVLALQETPAGPLPLHDPFVDSAGLATDAYIVTLFQLFLGPEYELVQSAAGACGTRLAAWLHAAAAPRLLGAHSCLLETAGGPAAAAAVGGAGAGAGAGAGGGRPSLSARVRAQLSGPAAEEVSGQRGAGCGLLVALRACRPLVFLASGGAGEEGAHLVLAGAQAARFRPFNLLAPGRDVFWMASDPWRFPVAAFAGLASNPAAGHILARCTGLSQLCSSDALASGRPSSSVAPASEHGRPVACSCEVPQQEEEETAAAAAAPARLLNVAAWDLGLHGGPWAAGSGSGEALRVELSGEDGHAAARSAPSRTGAWPAPLALSAWARPLPALEVRLVAETRGRLLARGELAPLTAARDAPAALRVELWDATGAPAGTLCCSLRWSVAPQQPPAADPILELLGRSPAPRGAPPPVPQRPHKPAADLLTF